MRTRKTRTPKLCRHKSSGRAYVRIEGKQIYLGQWGTEKAEQKYRAFIAEWKANHKKMPARRPGSMTVGELIWRYLDHVKEYYQSNELYRQFCWAMRPLRRLYSESRAEEFGPNALRAIQNWWVDQGVCRNTANMNVSRARMAFKWATEHELISGHVIHALACVSNLKKGRSRAKDHPRVRPASWGQVKPVLEEVQPHIRAMLLLMWHTGARPGEVCRIRGCEINTSVTPWAWSPSQHKTAYLNHERTIYIGPEGRAILKEWLRKNPNQYLFSPAQAVAYHQKNLKGLKKRELKPHYETRRLWQAVQRGCKRAKVESWHPNQIRHAFATRVAKKARECGVGIGGGLALVQALLGHSKPDTTTIYAERDEAFVSKVIEEHA